jgi:hypothetical protein
MIASVVTVMLEVKIKSSEQTKRTFCGDVYMIRRYLFNLLPQTPGKGNFNFRVAWATNMYELPGSKVYNTIAIQKSGRLNVLKSGDNTIYLISGVICDNEDLLIHFPSTLKESNLTQ